MGWGLVSLLFRFLNPVKSGPGDQEWGPGWGAARAGVRPREEGQAEQDRPLPLGMPQGATGLTPGPVVHIRGPRAEKKGGWVQQAGMRSRAHGTGTKLRHLTSQLPPGL